MNSQKASSPIIMIALMVTLLSLALSFYILLTKSSTNKKTDDLQNPTTNTLIYPTITKTAAQYDLQRKSELYIIRPALEMYRAEKRRYPDTLKELIPNYIVVMPLDPKTNTEYGYQVSQSKINYSLSAKLEDGTIFTINAPN